MAIWGPLSLRGRIDHQSGRGLCVHSHGSKQHTTCEGHAVARRGYESTERRSKQDGGVYRDVEGLAALAPILAAALGRRRAVRDTDSPTRSEAVLIRHVV
jgi:hypothetical protein